MLVDMNIFILICYCNHRDNNNAIIGFDIMLITRYFVSLICIVAALFFNDMDHSIKYAYVDDPKSRQDADQYCADTYGWRLASFYT